MKKIAIVLFLVVFLAQTPKHGLSEITFPVYDSQLIERDLIVVAKVEKDSLKQFFQKGKHFAKVRLITEEILKGKSSANKINVRIRMHVIVGGYYESEGGMVNLRANNNNYPEDKIEVIEGRGWGSESERVDLSKSQFQV